MKIGDKVTYREGNMTSLPVYGEIVRPTEEEFAARATWEYPPASDEVLVAWNDGERYWEFRGDLVKVELP